MLRRRPMMLLVVLLFGAVGHAHEIIELTLDDGEVIKSKLYLPDRAEHVKAIVCIVHGTGPNTYEDPREVAGKRFKFYDMIGDELVRRGLGCFTFNRRGVEIGEQPPNFDTVDREKFRKGVPSVEVNDIGTMIATLRKRPELSNARFVLLGFSEGTMVASLVAERKENDIAALMLVGYAHENLYDIIKWQFSGESSMRNLRPPFDANQDDDISREEFESSEDVPTAWREKVLQGVSFDSLDRNSDGVLTVEDYRILLAPHYKMLLEKIEANDADWVWDNFFRVSIEWLNEHFQLEPNKVRLLRLDMPIHVFHGKRDANCDVEGVYDLRRSFEEAGKDNLRTWIFDDHDHQLNFFDWIFKDKMSKGYQRLFEVASELRDPVFTSNTQK
ncbi:MAG: alpha/beta fold hydrolase [Pirellulaceae bacterium]